MKKIHVVVIALLLGLAAVFGTMAATRTAGLGASSRHTQDALVQKRVRQLNAFEASLRRQLAQGSRAAAPATAAAPAPRVVYHRPPPIVIVKHSHHGDDGFENASGGGDD